MFDFAATQSEKEGQEVIKPLVNISCNPSGLDAYLFLTLIMSFTPNPWFNFSLVIFTFFSC